MTIAFRDLPKATQKRIIKSMCLPKNEERLLWLRYIEEFNYTRIAAELHISCSSVGPLLTKTRKHVIKIANECYELAPDEVKKSIDMLEWRSIEWPVIYNRNKIEREGGKE